MRDKHEPGVATPAIIRLRDVYKTYDASVPVHALRPCNLEIAIGDYLCITGPSGSGKSTLLNILGLLDSPTGGVYILGERSVAGLSDGERSRLRAIELGFVFQSFQLLSYMTALQNVEVGLVYDKRTPRKERASRAADALVSVGLGHRVHSFPGTLSGGEQQRVAIARALARRPRVLLCDEPTGNLDSTTATRILDLLSEVNEAGQVVVVVTHDAEVARRASRVVSIRDGVMATDHRGSVR